MDLGLKGKKIIVTGGASHIGRAIVLTFAAEGAALAIIDRDSPQAEATAAEALKRGAASASIVEADLADHNAATRACETAMAKLGGIDALVTNVGWNRPDFFLKLPQDGWRRTLDVNLTSVFSSVAAVLPAMIAQRHGAVVSTASTAAFGAPRQSIYAAAKAGVVAFIKTIAQEYGRDGIRANCVAPGLTLPEGAETMGAQSLWHDRDSVMNAAQIDHITRNTPLRRLPQAQDIANAIVLLASETASHVITGEVVTVSGGFQMR